MTEIFKIKKLKRHICVSFFGIKLKLKYWLRKNIIKKFEEHDASGKILIVELNDCHFETLIGYYHYFKKLGYDIEVLSVVDMENVFSRMTNPPFVWELYPCEAREIFERKLYSKYSFVFLNSKILYEKTEDDICDVYPGLMQNSDNIFVQHHIDRFYENSSPKQIILANPSENQKLNNHIVNPHYFGDVNITQKNNFLTNFITVGELSTKRKNSKILIDAVLKLIEKGVSDFKITVIGRGNFDDCPGHLKKYFDVLGRVDFSKMYTEIEKADYILPLLDPDMEAHKRYMKDGTSGSFQLAYGFLKPCILHKTFAEIYDFSDENSIIYNSNDELADKMLKAIKTGQSEYLDMQNKLKIKVDEIEKTSLENLYKILRNN